MAPIRTAVRTGDTTAAQRQSMLRKPPHVLVTTPESLYILLTAEKSRALFAGVATVIVDEIHAMAATSAARISRSRSRVSTISSRRRARRKPQRIGLSATVRPLEKWRNS